MKPSEAGGAYRAGQERQLPPLHAGYLRIAALTACVFGLCGCVPGDGSCTLDDPAGFFSGVWHGWIAPISLIWGFFDPSVRPHPSPIQARAPVCA